MHTPCARLCQEPGATRRVLLERGRFAVGDGRLQHDAADLLSFCAFCAFWREYLGICYREVPYR